MIAILLPPTQGSKGDEQAVGGVEPTCAASIAGNFLRRRAHALSEAVMNADEDSTGKSLTGHSSVLPLDQNHTGSPSQNYRAISENQTTRIR